MTRIYKILAHAAWEHAELAGVYPGSAVDLTDGFIHFSTAAQVGETAARHFRGQADLVVVEVDSAGLGAALRWEPSRGGTLFPHLYGPLAMRHVLSVTRAPLDPGGVPILAALG